MTEMDSFQNIRIFSHKQQNDRNAAQMLDLAESN